MTEFQSAVNVTVPAPENCTSPSMCWTDGNYTFTLKNISQTYNIKKCERGGDAKSFVSACALTSTRSPYVCCQVITFS